ncbi:uncharacterized protein LOC121995545 isoform X3 [Zingiber officinale]|uniref:uncharacterized protein LOC121995545 isoform X3 n=1 Tax=Zingiber officinale TaxID=94328 RepID=UPI001C4B4200|nr:uncharacterized protein LOC121995545 isoform X3 [Zingiber officinale]
MGAESLSSSTGVVEGIHGARMMERSAFGVDEALVREDTNYSSCKGSGITGTNQVLQIRRIWEQRPPCLRPIRCTLHGDQNISETVVNVLTSLPFVFLGLQVPRKNINNKLYATSLIGVGIASSLYHSSRGQFRKYLRWADYTMIATSTIGYSPLLVGRQESFKWYQSGIISGGLNVERSTRDGRTKHLPTEVRGGIRELGEKDGGIL